ncbi:hypothetical protein KUF71_019803 [Frankliniella fusca]|uniref:Peptidase A2 domain-containing protein n=1 Tax=Frankliniella fusca TaxID=407009 RepID=A0AAE1GVL2_9NEOP|nr:hypothetical protein KUF71_019803 [Frankliniella fusca]
MSALYTGVDNVPTHGVCEIAGPSAAWRAEPAQVPDRPWQGTSEDMYHTQEGGGQQHDTDWDCLFQFQAVPQGQVQGGPTGPQPQPRPQPRPRRPIKVPVHINGDVVEMEIDTGAGVSIIDEHTLRQHWPNIPLQPSPLRLRAWNGTAVPVVGQVMVTAAFGGVTAQVSIHVGRGKGPTLLGRNWFWLLGFRVVHGAVPDWVTELNWAQVPASRPDQLQHRTSPGGAAGAGVVNAQQYLQRFACFKSGLGRYNGPPVHLSVDPECPPIRFRARPVPYARREGVEKEIDRLVQEGTFTPVTASHWQTPLVIVTKQDGSPRLCGDYRLTVNKALQPDPYPVTTLEEAFAQLAGGSCFTKLDLAMAYAQLPVTPEIADLLTVTTSKGTVPPRERFLRVQILRTPPPSPDRAAGPSRPRHAPAARRRSVSPAGWRRPPHRGGGAVVPDRAPTPPSPGPEPRAASAPLPGVSRFPGHFTRRMKKRYTKQRREFLFFGGPPPTRWEEVDDEEVRARLEHHSAPPTVAPSPAAASKSATIPPAPADLPYTIFRWDDEQQKYVVVSEGNQPARSPPPTSPSAADTAPDGALDEDVSVYSAGGETSEDGVEPMAAATSGSEDDRRDPDAHAADIAGADGADGADGAYPGLRPRCNIRPPAALADYALDDGSDVEDLQIHVVEAVFDWGDLSDADLASSQ